MSNTARFGVSLDADLLKLFDGLLDAKGYGNRSEALRDLIRSALIKDKWDENEAGAGALLLVYDHHRNDLSRRLTAIQHESFNLVVAGLHVHVDHENCLEILVLKGAPKELRALADKLIATTGVKYGVFNPVSTG